jgi:hypothetical protein
MPRCQHQSLSDYVLMDMLLGNVRGFVELGWSDGGADSKTTDVWFRGAPTTADWASEHRGGATTRCQTNHPKSRILLPTQIPTTLKIDTSSSPPLYGIPIANDRIHPIALKL